MIQRNVVYHKTSKGTEAIANRQFGLGPKLRSALILVDGKRGVEELSRLWQAFGDSGQLLAQLTDQGLIEPVQVAAPAGTGTPAGMLTASGQPFSLSQAQRFASRRLYDLLGPSAEPAALKIEAARNAQDLQAALKLATLMINDVRSSNVAVDFAAEVQAYLPAV